MEKVLGAALYPLRATQQVILAMTLAIRIITIITSITATTF